MGCGVDTACHTRNHGKSGLGQRRAEALCHAQTVSRTRPRPDDGHARCAVKIGQRSPDVQHSRRIGDLAQAVGVSTVLYGDDLNFLLLADAQNVLCAGEILVTQRIDLTGLESGLHELLACRTVQKFRCAERGGQLADGLGAQVVPGGQPQPVYAL